MSAVWLIIGLSVGAAAMAVVMRVRIGAARRELEHERALAQERLKGAQSSHEQLAESFRALSQEALQANMQQLTEMAKAQLGTAQQQAQGDLKLRQQAVENLVKPLAEQLRNLNEAQQRSSGQLSAHIRQLGEQYEKLRTDTGQFVSALRNPNAAGQWGQMQLRRVVELAGMNEYADFEEQFTITGGGGEALRPDLVVHLPGDKDIFVDAKATPVSPLAEAYGAGDDVVRTEHLKRLSSALRAHVDGLARKRYWQDQASSPDFVVMFLPGEYLYGAALEVDPGLMEYAMRQRVLIATPTTLLALLHSAAYGWQQQRLTERTQEVARTGQELYRRLVRMSDGLQRVGQRIRQTVEAYDTAVGTYQRSVMPQARRFQAQGIVAANDALEEPPALQIEPRPVELHAEDARVLAQGDAQATLDRL